MTSDKHVNMNENNCVKFRSGLPANELKNRNGVSVELDEKNVPYTMFNICCSIFKLFVLFFEKKSILNFIINIAPLSQSSE